MAGISFRVAIAAMVCSAAAYGQAACTVTEEQKVATITGRFAVGTAAVAVTLPKLLYPWEPAVVYPEVRGGGWDGMRLESGSETVEVRDGAALRLHPKRNERLTISLRGANGRLCEWVTTAGTAKRSPWHEVDGFREPALLFRVNKLHGGFRNAGDPILLAVGGVLAEESAVFSVDGDVATVLARNGPQVVLRDPHPAAGMRNVTCRGYSINLPMIVLEVRTPAAQTGRVELELHVKGRERVGIPPLPRARLVLYNFDPGRLKVMCGRPVNYGDPRIVTLEAKQGELVASCRVQVLKTGKLSVDGAFVEAGAAARVEAK